MRVYPIAIYSLATLLATLDINYKAVANPVTKKSQPSTQKNQDIKTKIETNKSNSTKNYQNHLINISQPETITNSFSDTETIQQHIQQSPSLVREVGEKGESSRIPNLLLRSPDSTLVSNDQKKSNIEKLTKNTNSPPLSVITEKTKLVINHKTQNITQNITQTLPDPNAPTEIPDFPPVEETPPLTESEIKDELGEIEIIQPKVKQPPRRKQPNAQLLLRSSAFTSSNITSLENLRDGDTIFVNSATLLVTPKLGKQTRLIATAGGGLARFATEGDSNYNFLNFSLGVQQRIGKGMYAQFGWAQDRIYQDDDGDRVLLDDSLRLVLGRQDQLDKKLRLDSFYELRGSFTTPDEQSRIANSLGARLRYDITPDLQGAINYRLSFQDFTQESRFDTRHQLGMQAIYSINRDLFIGGSASYLFGSSNDSDIDLDNFSLGINVGLNVPLF
ncbi:MAG: outer membrane beta-barrel protein [Cyanobacteria bacterium P01_A01_bin.84]